MAVRLGSMGTRPLTSVSATRAGARQNSRVAAVEDGLVLLAPMAGSSGDGNETDTRPR